MTSPRARGHGYLLSLVGWTSSLALAPNLPFSSTQQSLHVVGAQSTFLDWKDVIGLLTGASKARQLVSLQ